MNLRCHHNIARRAFQFRLEWMHKRWKLRIVFYTVTTPNDWAFKFQANGLAIQYVHNLVDWNHTAYIEAYSNYTKTHTHTKLGLINMECNRINGEKTLFCINGTEKKKKMKPML